jgi:chromate transport protein ChrA
MEPLLVESFAVLLCLAAVPVILLLLAIMALKSLRFCPGARTVMAGLTGLLAGIIITRVASITKRKEKGR